MVCPSSSLFSQLVAGRSYVSSSDKGNDDMHSTDAGPRDSPGSFEWQEHYTEGLSVRTRASPSSSRGGGGARTGLLVQSYLEDMAAVVTG